MDTRVARCDIWVHNGTGKGRKRHCSNSLSNAAFCPCLFHCVPKCHILLLSCPLHVIDIKGGTFFNLPGDNYALQPNETIWANRGRSVLHCATTLFISMPEWHRTTHFSRAESQPNALNTAC